jgi:hypothetical protein
VLISREGTAMTNGARKKLNCVSLHSFGILNSDVTLERRHLVKFLNWFYSGSHVKGGQKRNVLDTLVALVSSGPFI